MVHVTKSGSKHTNSVKDIELSFTIRPYSILLDDFFSGFITPNLM